MAGLNIAIVTHIRERLGSFRSYGSCICYDDARVDL